ncbi:MFS transporter [Acidibrevibacterium fodinaquatile]|uniref:MFS transporter n=1 Tax=Acidibrevibacterium fodinaquatile TaxID=1969806 RepID=UPI000E0D49A0
MSLAFARNGRIWAKSRIAAWPSPVRRLFVARFLRSLAQGCLVVDFTLYLHSLHWSGTSIGAVLAGSFVLGAVLSLLVGPASDRFGCKRLLIGYEVAVALAFFAVAWSNRPAVIAIAAVFAGFGRGANGAPGCFVPVELSWLAGLIPVTSHGAAYSINTAAGFLGMGFGALFAVAPTLWSHALPGVSSYQPLFLIGGAIALVIAGLLATIPESRPPKKDIESASPLPPLAHDERKRLWYLGLISLFSGVSLGLSGPLIAYWFAVKFYLDPLQIAPALAASYFAAAFSAMLTGQLTERFGSASSFVFLQGLGALLLLGFPFLPSFPLAALVWILRFAIERGATGAMEAVMMTLVGASRRGLAGGLGTAALALPRGFGPLIAGDRIAANDLAAPFLLAAFLQILYVVLFGFAFLARDRGFTKI